MVSGNCIDIDECAIGVPSCFDCVNTVGRFDNPLFFNINAESNQNDSILELLS